MWPRLSIEPSGSRWISKIRRLLGAPFAQFLKVNSDFRYLWNIDKNQAIAGRVAGGLLWSYGNMTVAPYSEQFYAGGAK